MKSLLRSLEEAAPGKRSYQDLEDKQMDGVSAAARKALRTMDATIAPVKMLQEWWKSTHEMLQTMDDAASSHWRGETEKWLARATDAQGKAKELRAILQHLDPYYGGMR